jgi:GDP-4-dehydro-6-deoxy-D-mannose reductase
MRILVTGVTGFAGGHLAELLRSQADVELFGVSRRGRWPAEWRHLANVLSLQACDLCDRVAVEAMLRKIQPERIYHLAGYAHSGRSFQEVEAAWTGNLAATRSLYDAVDRWGRRPRILYVGSGLIYGDLADEDRAHSEDSPMRPASPYAVSKAAADLVSYQYTRSPGLDIVRARPFNHIGPGQSPGYAVAHFAQQIAAIERGRQAPILETGNLAPLRDLTDVRDIVQAYVLLMERGRTGEAYNVATGEAHAIRTVLTRLLALARVPIEVWPQARLLRSTDPFVVRGDAAKLRHDTGWAPRLSLDRTLADTLEYWRSSDPVGNGSREEGEKDQSS